MTDILPRSNKPYLVGKVFNNIFLIINSDLKYQSIDLTFSKAENHEMKLISNIQCRSTGDNTLLLIFSKFSFDDEAISISELQLTRGLLSNVEGKNSNYWYITDHVIHFPLATITTIPPSVKGIQAVPGFPKGIVVDSIAEKIETLDLETKGRIKLALRWIDSAEHEMKSIDEFLKLWFSIETIVMPNATHIRSLARKISTIYSISESKADKKFGIGRIFGLRSSIVNNGFNIGIHFQLNQFLKAMFNDVLLNLCGLPSEYKARQVLDDSRVTKNEWMP